MKISSLSKAFISVITNYWDIDIFAQILSEIASFASLRDFQDERRAMT